MAHQAPVGFPAMPCLTAAGLGLDSDQPSSVSIMNQSMVKYTHTTELGLVTKSCICLPTQQYGREL